MREREKVVERGTGAQHKRERERERKKKKKLYHLATVGCQR